MRVYIASKYIAHKELNRKIYEELVHAEIPAFLPESINMDAIGKSVSSELGYAIALRRVLKQKKIIIALNLDFEKEAMLIPYVDKAFENIRECIEYLKQLGTVAASQKIL